MTASISAIALGTLVMDLAPSAVTTTSSSMRTPPNSCTIRPNKITPAERHRWRAQKLLHPLILTTHHQGPCPQEKLHHQYLNTCCLRVLPLLGPGKVCREIVNSTLFCSMWLTCEWLVAIAQVKLLQKGQTRAQQVHYCNVKRWWLTLLACGTLAIDASKRLLFRKGT